MVKHCTIAETLAAIIRDEPVPVGQLNAAIPAPLRWIVDRCLAKNPAERYASRTGDQIVTQPTWFQRDDGWRTRRTRPEVGVDVTSFPEPSAKWQVSTNGGYFPVWRRDGLGLFYRRPDGMLMAVPIAPGNHFAPGTPIPLFQPRAQIGGLGMGTFYDVAPTDVS